MANGTIRLPEITFPVTPNPPTGRFYIGFDSSNGHLTIQDDAGVVTDIQSGASYTNADAVNAVRADIIARTNEPEPQSDDFLYLRDVSAADFKRASKLALQKADPDRFFQLFADFIGTAAGEFTQYISGTGASVQAGTYGQDAINNAIGVTQVDTGTTATGRAGLGTISGAVFRPTLAKLKSTMRLALEALSTPAETFTIRAGLGDFFVAGGDGTNGLFFRYTDLVNGGRWQAVSRRAGIDVNVVDTGVSPDLDFNNFEVEIDENGLQARFYINSALVATMNDPDLPGIGNPMGAGFNIQKTVGLTQRNLSADWMLFSCERAAAR